MNAPHGRSRRDFLRTASTLAVGTTAGLACTTETIESRRATDPETTPARATGFDRARLDALATAVLPESLGEDGIRRATDAFVAWADGYAPVAEEMHGYGYAEVRYLPADPVPGWRAQLDGLDLLAQRTQRGMFAALPLAARRDVLRTALRGERIGARLPSPLAASHIAIALLAHWAASPDAIDRALGAQVGALTCRPLGDVLRAPLPLADVTT